MVFVFLMCLMVGVVYFDFGVFNDFIVLLIVIIKVSFVVWFFMYVNYVGWLVKLMVGVGVVWLIIMFGMMIVDYVF